MHINENELSTVNGGTASYIYNFRSGEDIWAKKDQSAYFHVNQDISTNNPDDEISVTLFYTQPSMISSQTVTKSAYALKDYLDKFGYKR